MTDWRWEIKESDDGTEIHVLPLEDWQPHIFPGLDCPCRLDLEVYDSCTLVTHNAYDKRQLVERMFEKRRQRERR